MKRAVFDYRAQPGGALTEGHQLRRVRVQEQP